MKKLQNSIDRFCILHPNFGIPGLMRYIIGGTILVYILSMFSKIDGGLLSLLVFQLDKVMQGQVWRLFTFLFIPADSYPLTLIITCYFYYWIGTVLEREWGTAKFTLYYISGALLTLLGVTVLSLISGISYPISGLFYVNLAMFLAFAVLYPEAQLLLFFIIPLKAKWLAYLDAALFAFEIISALIIHYTAGALVPLIALVNFYLFFAQETGSFFSTEHTRSKQASHFHNNIKQAQREQRAQGYRHKCTVCGRTDLEHPDLQFRYCSRCAGYHCYCVDHIFDHTHITEENGKE